MVYRVRLESGRGLTTPPAGSNPAPPANDSVAKSGKASGCNPPIPRSNRGGVSNMWCVVQQVRTGGCDPPRRGFESHRSTHIANTIH